MTVKKATGRMSKQREIEMKKRKRRKRRLIILLIIIAIIGIYAYLLNADIFKIKDIEIIGNKQLRQEQIYEQLGVKLGESIFSNFNIVTKVRLKQNRYIEDVKITKKYPNKLLVEIKERENKYQIQTETGLYIYIDCQGYITNCATEKLDLITIIGMNITENDLENKNRLEDEDLTVKLENILQIEKEMQEIEIFEKITEIQVKDNYIISLENEITINLGNATDLKSRMYYVKAILNKETGNTGTINVNGNLNEGFSPYFTSN